MAAGRREAHRPAHAGGWTYDEVHRARRWGLRCAAACDFAINLDAAERSGLRLSSRLLGLAKVVRNGHVQ